MTINSVKVNSGYNSELRNQIKLAYSSHAKQYFASTLGQVNDIVNILAAQSFYESSFQLSRMGITVSSRSGTGGYDYLYSSAVQSALQSASPTQKINIDEGLRAIGLGQVMGWNFVRGGSRGGKCEIERLRPDLASLLCVNPGESIPDKIQGEANINLATLSQMVLLEGKYKQVTQDSSGYTTVGDREFRHYSTRIEAALSAYLGLGRYDGNGTNPRAYTQTIYGGKAYVDANGSNFAVASQTIQGAFVGPPTNGSGKPIIVPTGC